MWSDSNEPNAVPRLCKLNWGRYHCSYKTADWVHFSSFSHENTQRNKNLTFHFNLNCPPRLCPGQSWRSRVTELFYFPLQSCRYSSISCLSVSKWNLKMHFYSLALSSAEIAVTFSTLFTSLSPVVLCCFYCVIELIFLRGFLAWLCST